MAASEGQTTLSSNALDDRIPAKGRLKLINCLSLIALGLTLLAAQGCQSLQRGGAPATAVHHAEYRYRYYPDSAVYMDIARKLFFYYNGEKWMTTTLLPAGIQVDWKNYVMLEMETDKPYKHHAETARKYPPAQRNKREGTKTEKN